MNKFKHIKNDSECEHFLFPHEEYYTFCPSCGEIIWSNVSGGEEKVKLLTIRKMLKRLLNPKIAPRLLLLTALIALVNYFVLQPITIFHSQISIPAFDYNSNNHYDIPFSDVAIITFVLILIFIPVETEIRDNIRKKYAISILEERGYAIITSWRRWLIKFGSFITYCLLVNYLLPKLQISVSYADYLIYYGYHHEAEMVMQVYRNASLYYFNFYALVVLILNIFFCFRQRLVVRVNEADYLSGE